jgi:transaldolase
MKFFIDTANISEIEEGLNLGVVDGVTTNPSLMAKEGIKGNKAILNHYLKICKMVDGPVSAEVIATDYKGMMKEAHQLKAIHKNIVVKVPMIPEGLKAIKALAAEGIPTNCTLVFSEGQALLAAKAGATYVSPFIGRLDDYSADGVGLIENIVVMYQNYGFTTQVLAASIRHPEHIVGCAMAGADVATCPLHTIKGLMNHPLTTSGLEKFLADYKKLNS